MIKNPTKKLLSLEDRINKAEKKLSDFEKENRLVIHGYVILKTRLSRLRMDWGRQHSREVMRQHVKESKR